MPFGVFPWQIALQHLRGIESGGAFSAPAVSVAVVKIHATVVALDHY